MNKTVIYILLATLLATTTTAQLTSQDLGQIYKHTSQEGQNTRDYLKTELEQQLELNHQDIQAQIDDNKIGFFLELNSFIKAWAIKISIAWFTTTLLALISYRLIMMRLTRRYRHAKMRDEIYGG